MQFIYFTLFSVIEIIIVFLYLLKKKLLESSGSKKVWIIIGLSGFILFYIVQMTVYPNTSIINLVKLCILFLILFIAALVDFKRKVIPNELIIAGLSCRLILYFFEFFLTANFKEVLFSDLIGFLIGFGILAIISFITRQALGFGDVKLFAVIGLMSGSYGTYSTLFMSVLISAIVSIVLLISKKKGRKDTIPFGPCVFLGYLFVLLLGSY